MKKSRNRRPVSHDGTLVLRLAKEQRKGLEKVAARTKRSLSETARAAFDQFLERERAKHAGAQR